MTTIRNDNGTIKVSGNLTGLDALKLKTAITLALEEKGTPIVDIRNAHPVGFMALHILKDFYGLIWLQTDGRPEIMTLIEVLEIEPMVIGS